MRSKFESRPAWCRAALALTAGAALSLAAGCASERGVATQDAIGSAMREAVRPPSQAVESFAVPPKPVIPRARARSASTSTS